MTVTGPPRAICLRKVGITLPDDPSTFPKRTPQNFVPVFSRWPQASTSHSQSAFVWPMTFFGATALSVETRTNRFAPNSTAALATVRVTSVLFRTASAGFASTSGTCLYAAAWKTTPGRYFSKTCRIFVAFPASASTAAVAWKLRSSTSSRSISKRPRSPLSTSTSLVGPTRAIWRQSSAPIEPPAPVTSTTSPVR